MAELDEIAATAYDAGRDAGYRDALVDVAERVVELDDSWRPAARITHEQRVAERVALFERCAEEFSERELGRPYREYRGGPIDWETGEPLQASGGEHA